MVDYIRFGVHALVFTILMGGTTLIWESRQAAHARLPRWSSPQPWCGVIDGRDIHPGMEVLYKLGKTTFRNYCGSCHAKDMGSELTGPALGNSFERWNSDTLQWGNWVQNSQMCLDTTKNDYARRLWTDWQPVVMTAFPSLTDEEIRGLITYANC